MLSSEYDPAVQGCGEPPVLEQEYPAAQASHVVTPPELYDPEEHGVGSESLLGHSWPAGQVWQNSCASSGLKKPSVQAVQAVEPALAYSPAEQATGSAVAEGHSYPAPHWEQLADPTSEA